MECGKTLIEIIACVIKQEKWQGILDCSFDHLLKLAKRHSVENLLYYGLKDVVDGTSLEKLQKINQIEVYKAAVQASEQESICAKLESKEIAHMPLKGIAIKKLYPTEDMRQMADLDILIDPKKLMVAKEVMLSLGYDAKHLGGNHDVYYKKPFMNVELHRGMMDESYAMASFYHNIWDKVTLIENSSYYYEMNDEDFYVYMIAHMAKHFANGGTGIRSFLDVYMYVIKKGENLNWGAIDEMFQALGIEIFAKNAKKLALYWFGGITLDEDLNAVETYIINSGTYGTIAHANIMRGFMGDNADIHLNATKFKFLLYRIFPPFRIMKARNPILKKIPILLPWFYLTRSLKAIFKRRKFTKQHIQGIIDIKKEDVEKIKEVHDKSGIKKP